MEVGGHHGPQGQEQQGQAEEQEQQVDPTVSQGLQLHGLRQGVGGMLGPPEVEQGQARHPGEEVGPARARTDLSTQRRAWRWGPSPSSRPQSAMLLWKVTSSKSHDSTDSTSYSFSRQTVYKPRR